jgi:hypothetical protein
MSHPNRFIDRRSFLRIGAVAGAMACAGCGAEGEGSVKVEGGTVGGGRKRLDMLKDKASKATSKAPPR